MSHRLLRMLHMLEPPSSLLHPVVLAGMLGALASRVVSWFSGRPASPSGSPGAALKGLPAVQISAA